MLTVTPSLTLSRRRLGMGAALLASASERALAQASGNCTTVPDKPTTERPDPQPNARDFSEAEVALAFRSHGLQYETLDQQLTPIGEHYLLTHFDIPALSADNYFLAIGGLVSNPQRLSLTSIKALPSIDQVVTMQCAGVGRRRLAPRPVYVPWEHECIGTYRWTGTPLRPLLEKAGLEAGAVEVLFTGWDAGIDLGVEHAFERSLPIQEALQDEVMLAWAQNGQTLLPEHGFPLRLIVPSWYGMASVKWLRAITILPEAFQGVQQKQVYIYQQVKDGPAEPVTRKRVDSVMIPPGRPDLLTRDRYVHGGQQQLQGKAWTGTGTVTKVEVSTNGGTSWQLAQLAAVAPDPYAWVEWSVQWSPRAGQSTLMCRATDSAGNVQPVDPQTLWNLEGNAVAASQQIKVTLLHPAEDVLDHVPCVAHAVARGAKVPPLVSVTNTMA